VFSVKISSFINSAAVITESAGILILTILLTVFAISNHNPISNVVAINPAVAGKSLLVPILMSFLMGFYTLVAFESAANMSDETHSASKNVPKAMIMAVGFSTLFGTLFLIATTWSIKNLGAVISSSSPIPFIIESNLGGVISKMFYVVICISIFACGLVFLTHASRTAYAMSRDNAFFASKLFRKVSKKASTPVPACIFLWVICCAFLVTTTPSGLIAASAAMPCLYYIITIFSYLMVRKNIKFPQDHFNLGKLGVPLIILALCWLVFGLSILSIPPCIPYRHTDQYKPHRYRINPLSHILQEKGLCQWCV
jgi:amino acid transporter